VGAAAAAGWEVSCSIGQVKAEHHKWMRVRLLFVVFFGLGGISLAQIHAAIPWIGIGFFFLVPLFMIPFLIWTQLSQRKYVLHRPSWHLNPFLRGDLFQMPHLGACCFMACGATGSIAGLMWHGWELKTGAPESLFPLVAGFSIWLSIHLCCWLFAKRITEDSEDSGKHHTPTV
jgi:hypothetical protein